MIREMKIYLTVILIGLVSAFIGIIPLLKKKADRYSLIAAFLLFFMIVYSFYLPIAINISSFFFQNEVILACRMLAKIISFSSYSRRNRSKTGK